MEALFLRHLPTLIDPLKALLPSLFGVLKPPMLILTRGNHGWHGDRSPLAINTNKSKVASKTVLSFTGLRVFSEDLHTDLHAGASGVVDLSTDNHNIPNPDRALKYEVVDCHRDTGLTTVPRCRDRCSHIHPRHNPAAEESTMKVTIWRLNDVGCLDGRI
jgi:hypothetical protein